MAKHLKNDFLEDDPASFLEGSLFFKGDVLGIGSVKPKKWQGDGEIGGPVVGHSSFLNVLHFESVATHWQA